MKFTIRNIEPALNGKFNVTLEALYTPAEVKELMDLLDGRELNVK